MLRLNVGCGLDVREGWVNLDAYPHNGVDVVFDLNKINTGEAFLPFKSTTFHYVLCSHILEDFIEPIPIMNELARVTKVGGIVEIRVPFHTKLLVGNINHKRGFSIGTLNGYTFGGGNYKEAPKMQTIEAKYYTAITDKKCLGYWHARLCVFLCNLWGWHLTETTPLQYLFNNLDVVMIYRKMEGIN